MVEVLVSEQDIEMLITGEKTFLCVDDSKFFKADTNTILLINRRSGVSVGTAYVYQYSDVFYNKNFTDAEWSISRMDALKEVYCLWCEYKVEQPEDNTGWLHSEEFKDYLKLIKWGGNYILYLTDIKINHISKVM